MFLWNIVIAEFTSTRNAHLSCLQMKNELAERMDTRSSSAIPFIAEQPLEEILGSRLPTKGQVF